MFSNELSRFGSALESLEGGGRFGEHSEFFDGIKGLLSREELRGLARRPMAGKSQEVRSGWIVCSDPPDCGFRHAGQ